MFATIASLAPCLLALAPAVGDPVITPLVLKGATTSTGAKVNLVLDTAVNDAGDWLATCDLVGSPIKADLVLSNLGEMFVAGQPILALPGTTLFGVSNSMQLADDATVAASILIDDPMSAPFLSGIQIGSQLHFSSGSQVSVSGFGGPVTLIGSGLPELISKERMFVTAWTTEVGMFGGPRTLVMDVQLDPVSSAILSITAPVQETDPIAAGKLYAIHQYSPRANAAGQIAYRGLIVPNDPTKPVYTGLVLDGQQVLAEGDVLPGLGGTLLEISRFAMNASGQLATRLLVDGVGATIFLDQAEVAREGAFLSGAPTLKVHAIHDRPIYVSGGGEVLWAGELDLPVPADQRRALFLDGAVLVREGVTHVDGSTVALLDLGQDGYEMSHNGRFLHFEAKLADGRNGTFLLDRFPPFAHPVPGISGLFGCGPFDGTLEPAGGSIGLGGTVQLTAAGAPSPSATAFLFVANALLLAPCGLELPGAGSLLLSPAPPNPLLSLSQASGGAPTVFSLTVPNWPALAGLPVFAQALFVDLATATPLRLTTGLELVLGSL